MAQIGGSASAEVDAPLEEVWALVEDVLSAPEWQSGLLSMTALERDDQGRAVLVATENDARVRTISSRVRFTYDAPTRLSWRQEEGELKRLDGAWVLEDLGDGRTRATYELDADPGRVLGMLVRGPVEGAIRRQLVEARPGELKDRIERG